MNMLQDIFMNNSYTFCELLQYLIPKITDKKAINSGKFWLNWMLGVLTVCLPKHVLNHCTCLWKKRIDLWHFFPDSWVMLNSSVSLILEFHEMFSNSIAGNMSKFLRCWNLKSICLNITNDFSFQEWKPKWKKWSGDMLPRPSSSVQTKKQKHRQYILKL